MYVYIVEVLGLNSEAASIISEYSSTLLPKRHDISKVLKSLQDLTWTALFLAYHQPRPVAGLHQHALSVRLNQMKMGSEKKWDCITKKERATSS